MIIELGGPDNITFNQLVEQIAIVSGHQANVSHVPARLMRLARLLTRRLRPDLAGLIEGGITFDTADMGFDSADLRGRSPQVEFHCVVDVIRQHFADSPVQRELASKGGI